MNRRDFLRAGAAVGAATGLGHTLIFPRRALAQAAAPVAGRARTGPLRLNANENPLGLPPAARQALIEALEEANRYPDAPRVRLVEALAAQLGVPPESVVLGNGSTELLQMIVQASSAPDATLVLADPTFEAILRYQRPHAYRVEKVPLTPSFAHDIARMKAKVRAAKGPTVVYLCNPNNPTGTLTPSAEIDAWVAEAPETVLFAIDEAYHEYAGSSDYSSAIRAAAERRNVIVTRTFSKIFGMAGLRLGYAVTHPKTADRLREFMASSNANVAALAAAQASLDDEQLIPRSLAANDEAKRIAIGCLEELGLECLPSHTNFLMHRIRGDLGTYRQRMKEHGILVGRPFPPMLSYNRLSLGLPEEMERFADTLRRLRREGQA